MKPQHDFTAQRALARHCAELLPVSPKAEHLLADFTEAGFNLARELRPALCSLLGGAELSIACGAAEPIAFDILASETGTQSVNSALVMQPDGAVMLASVSLHAVLALTGRACGGTGQEAEPLPEGLPLSADLALRQLDAALCHALGRATAANTLPVVVRRGSNLAQLNPFAGAMELVKLNLTVTQDDQQGWDICFAASAADLGQILGSGAGSTARTTQGSSNDPMAEPFGDVPLPVDAVLTEMNIPLSRLSQIAVGDTFPIQIAREIPLRIAGKTIGFGTVAAVDGRVAIQLTRALRPGTYDISMETN